MRHGLLLAAVAIAALSAGCSKKEAGETAAAAPVSVEPVRQQAMRRIIEADGILYPRDQAALAAKVSAPVRRFYVNRGAHVKAGQLLAELENRDLAAAAAAGAAQFEQAEANYRSTSGAAVPEEVDKARADVAAAEQSMDAASRLLESREKLFREGALARRLVDEARVAYAQSRSQLDTARTHLRGFEGIGKREQVKSAAAQVDAARAQYDAARAQVSYSELRSPIAGVVTDRPLYPGEMASAGAILLTVMDISRVVARANVPPEAAGLLRLGQAATITVTPGGPEAPGRVTVVSPALDPNSATVQVWVEAANPEERLKPGAAVRVSIVAGTLEQAVAVPEAALLPGSEGGIAVMIAGADRVAHERKVQTGVRDSGMVQILSGAAPGEAVITSGGVGLRDGTRIRILKPGESAGSAE